MKSFILTMTLVLTSFTSMASQSGISDAMKVELEELVVDLKSSDFQGMSDISTDLKDLLEDELLDTLDNAQAQGFTDSQINDALESKVKLIGEEIGAIVKNSTFSYEEILNVGKNINSVGSYLGLRATKYKRSSMISQNQGGTLLAGIFAGISMLDNAIKGKGKKVIFRRGAFQALFGYLAGRIVTGIAIDNDAREDRHSYEKTFDEAFED